MTRNSYFLHRLKIHKVSVVKVLVCLALIILVTSFALIQGFAYELPINGDTVGTVLDEGGYYSGTGLGYVKSIVHYQLGCGSFNNYQVVAVYYYGYTIRITLGYRSNAVRYQLDAGYFEPTSTANCPRMVLTTLGFEAYSSSPPATVAEENMIMYMNTDGELVENPNVITGTAESTNLLAPFSQWLEAVNAVVGGDTQGAYDEGYQDGYDDGRQEGYAEGREIGYAEGYSVGYDAGLAVGGGVLVNEEIDVGSIITALPQAARNIIDGAFGFTIFGINIAATLIAILVVAIVAFIVRWLLKR